MLGGFRGAHATVLQLFYQFFGGGSGKFSQPFLQARAHFGGGFFGESDGQYVLRLGSSQQGAKYARNQHPRFASACAGFYHNGTGGVAGYGVEVCTADCLAVGSVGMLGAWRLAWRVTWCGRGNGLHAFSVVSCGGRYIVVLLCASSFDADTNEGFIRLDAIRVFAHAQDLNFAWLAKGHSCLAS